MRNDIEKNILRAADYVIINNLNMKDISKILEVSQKTVRTYLKEYLKLYDIERYNDVLRVMNSDKYIHSQSIRNAIDVFNYIIHNKDNIKSYEPISKFCKIETLIGYLKTDYIKESYPRYKEVEDFIVELMPSEKHIVNSIKPNKKGIIDIIDFIINTDASIDEAAEFSGKSRCTIRKYLKGSPNYIGKERYDKLHNLLNSRAKNNILETRKKPCKELLDCIIENKCNVFEASKLINITHNRAYYLLKFAKEYFPSEYDEAFKILEKIRRNTVSTEYLYKLLVEENISSDDICKEFKLSKKALRLRVSDCLRKRDIEKYNKARIILNSEKLYKDTKYKISTVNKAKEFCEFIIANNVSIKTAASMCNMKYDTCKKYVSNIIKTCDKELYLKTIATVDVVSGHPRRKRVIHSCKKKPICKSSDITVSKNKKDKAVPPRSVIKSDDIKQVKPDGKPSRKLKKDVAIEDSVNKNMLLENYKSVKVNNIALSDKEQKEIAESLINVMSTKDLNIYEASEMLSIDVDIAQRCLFNNSDVFDDMLENIL